MNITNAPHEHPPTTLQPPPHTGLRIQRMGGSDGAAFGDPATYPYMTVASPSCHDVSNLRAWWEEDKDQQRCVFWWWCGGVCVCWWLCGGVCVCWWWCGGVTAWWGWLWWCFLLYALIFLFYASYACCFSLPHEYRSRYQTPLQTLLLIVHTIHDTPNRPPRPHLPTTQTAIFLGGAPG